MRRVLRPCVAAVATVVLVGAVLRWSGAIQRFEDSQSLDGEMRPSGFFARLYAAVTPWLGGWLYALFAKKLDLQPDDEVLDVACGSGAFLRKYAGRTRSVAGLDHSPDLIEIARRENRDRVADGTAEFVVGDVTALPWEDGRFSAVTSNCVDCYGSKERLALQEMYRVLRPGGRIVVGDDRAETMHSVGFTDVTVEHILWGDLTTGYKRTAAV